jgi:hypothetical protein
MLVVSGSYPDGGYIQNEYGDIPLHFASPCIVCFPAVLHSGNVNVTTMQDLNEETALHLSTEKRIGPAVLWKLLCYNRECVIIPGFRGVTALQLLEFYEEHFETITTQMNAKAVILKIAQYYNHLPKLPNDAMIEVV